MGQRQEQRRRIAEVIGAGIAAAVLKHRGRPRVLLNGQELAAIAAKAAEAALEADDMAAAETVADPTRDRD